MHQNNDTSVPGNQFGYSSFDVQPAEVIKVNYKDFDPEQIYNITVVPMHTDGHSTESMAITARPMNYNTKQIPMVGEVVLLVRGPSPGAGGIGGASQNYYIGIYSIQSLIHHNVLPGITKVSSDTKIDKTKYKDVSDGHVVNNDVKTKALFAKSFQERNDIRPIQPYAGDLIYEGRFNQSIRMSSTLKDLTDYTVAPSWQNGKSKTGDPILIIRNGRTPNSISKQINGFYVEDIENDLGSIWFTSGQQLPFKLRYSNYKAADRLGVNTFKVGDNFVGNQIGIFSDRVIIGAKREEILLHSEGGISVNTNKSLTFDVNETAETNANRINLGLNANERALLGDTTGEWLSSVLQQLIELINTMALEIHLTGVGPTSPPVQAPKYGAIAGALTALKALIPSLKSELVFLNKLPGEQFDSDLQADIAITEMIAVQEVDPAFKLTPEEIVVKEEVIQDIELKLTAEDIKPEEKIALEDEKVKLETEKENQVQSADAPIVEQPVEELKPEETTPTQTDEPQKEKEDPKISELRALMDSTPEKYKCSVGRGALEVAMKDVGIREYFDRKHPGGYNGGGFKGGENKKELGRIDEMHSNVGFNNTHDNFTKEGLPWCAAAVSTWWKEGGVPSGFVSIGADEWLNWGLSQGLVSKTAKQGAIICYGKPWTPSEKEPIMPAKNKKNFFDGKYWDVGHVGIVLAVNEKGQAIRTIEGNTSQKGYEREGGGCYDKVPAMKNFIRYILPPGCK